MIKVITTGGTIEGLEYSSENEASEGRGITIQSFFENAKVSFEYKILAAFSKDSRFITVEDRLLLADMIRKSSEERILVTHGTLTLVDTAKFLGQQGLNKVIVLVGAFILGTCDNTDAPFNLGFAISSLNHLKAGVFVAMHGQVFPWDSVIKNTKENRFESL